MNKTMCECIKFRDNYLLNDEFSFRITNDRVTFFDIHSTFDTYDIEFIKTTNAIFDDFMNFDFELSYFDYDVNDSTIIYAYECEFDIKKQMTKLKFKYENNELKFIEKMIDNDFNK